MKITTQSLDLLMEPSRNVSNIQNMEPSPSAKQHTKQMCYTRKYVGSFTWTSNSTKSTPFLAASLKEAMVFSLMEGRLVATAPP
jgi:hypothetical protein